MSTIMPAIGTAVAGIQQPTSAVARDAATQGAAANPQAITRASAEKSATNAGNTAQRAPSAQKRAEGAFDKAGTKKRSGRSASEEDKDTPNSSSNGKLDVVA